jgi:hypothetical protein
MSSFAASFSPWLSLLFGGSAFSSTLSSLFDL